MNNGRLAYDPDRLPWLPNEQRPPPKSPAPRRPPSAKSGFSWALVVPWVLLSLLILAGISYWLGMRSTRDEPDFARAPQVILPEASMTLPEARDAEPMRPPPVEVAPVIEAPEAEPQPAPPVRAAERAAPPPIKRAEARTPRAEPKTKAEPTKRRAAAKPQAAPKALRPWPATVVEGASGRMVRIGTFRTSRQAKRAWWRLMRTYPGMQRLKAVVVPVRSLRNNQSYYRLQFGTTSQAHSAVLCQRMRMIGQPCVVIG